MTDPRHTDEAPFVELEDRLLAHVIGLQVDPEIDAAAATDTVLRGRFEALRAEMALVGEQVARAVPEPDETYVDPAHPRWSALRPLLAHDEGRARVVARRRRRGGLARWFRVLAPVTAVVVAVAVGVSVLDNQSTDLSSGHGDEATTELDGSRAYNEVKSTESVAEEDADARFGVVLIARARRASGDFQRFDVVRVLRGAAPSQLRLRVASQPAATGLLHVVYLSPLTSQTGAADATLPPAESTADEPGSSGWPDAAALAEAILLGDDGETALAVQIPAGVDPDDISLP